MIEDPIIRDIPGFEGIYQISENGEVYSMVTGRKKSAWITSAGYYRLSLSKNKKDKNHLLHRLLALTFIKNPENKIYIDHIDRNTLNNDLNNLRWCSALENSQNKKIQKNNNSGENGIFCKKNNEYLYWEASISYEGEYISKLFPKTDEGFKEARLWRWYKEILLFKEFSPNFSKKEKILKEAEPFLEKWKININTNNSSGHKNISILRDKYWQVSITKNKIRLTKCFSYDDDGLKQAIEWRDDQSSSFLLSK